RLAAPAADADARPRAGRVPSAEDARREGVLVGAKREGGTVTVTVVTDKAGRYGFPAGRLEPGHYSLRVRAAGYDLDAPAAADVSTTATANVDLKLRKTEDLASQLSNGEWLAS